MQRRSERRYSVWESVILSVPRAEQSYWPATVVDISRSGYRVLSSTDLTPGTDVIITLNSVVIFGSVRHCERHDADTFTAGIHITRVSSEYEEPFMQPASAALVEA